MKTEESVDSNWQQCGNCGSTCDLEGMCFGCCAWTCEECAQGVCSGCGEALYD